MVRVRIRQLTGVLPVAVVAAKVRGAQAGLGLLWISGRGSDHSSLRLVPLEPSPDSQQATPPASGGLGGRCPALDELVAPRGLLGAHPLPPLPLANWRLELSPHTD